MKVGIIQSSYIPWRGYFDLIDDVDLFIYYDDTQYSKNTWRNRNKIKTANGLVWLTVPVSFSLVNKPNIEDVEINNNENWVRKHGMTISQAYSKAPYFNKYYDEFFELYDERCRTISKLNIHINEWIIKKLNISTEIKMSSEIITSGNKTDRLINILKKVGATSYLSGPAAKDYLDEGKFLEAGIGLEYKTYKYREYPQLHGCFEPQVSVLDMLFNCGEDARKYLKSFEPNDKVI